MKLLNVRFFAGTLLVGLGSLSVVIAVLSILPPDNNILLGIILGLVSIVLIFLGSKYVKDAPPPASKTAIDTLRQAGMLGKNRKN